MGLGPDTPFWGLTYMPQCKGRQPVSGPWTLQGAGGLPTLGSTVGNEPCSPLTVSEMGSDHQRRPWLDKAPSGSGGEAWTDVRGPGLVAQGGRGLA